MRKSIAIIGEGETEWFYFDSLRVACRYPFKLSPGFPQHADIEQILKAVNARYVYGLTATPIRKDGHQPIIFMQCGPIRYNADAKVQMCDQSFQRLLVPRFTPYRPISGEDLSFTKVG